MNTKKRGPTLLFSMFAVIILLGGILTHKNRVIASQDRKMNDVMFANRLEQEIIEGDREIQRLRERKRTNCELLGTGMSIALLDTCGQPQKKK